MHTKPEILALLKTFFKESASAYKIEIAFLYGSWARGFPKSFSDVDVAIVFSEEPSTEDEAFTTITDISLILRKKLKLDVNVIPIYSDFRRPMLYYNAIVLGIPVFIGNQDRYVFLRNQAIFQMEDFTLFGTKWQLEIAKKNLEDIKHA
jgi:predicted nucleotidyltransferase